MKPGYELIRVDHRSNQKRVDIGIYRKHFLPIKLNNASSLNECLSFNQSVNEKQCNVTLIYRSPSQPLDEFDTFSTNLNCFYVMLQIETRV